MPALKKRRRGSFLNAGAKAQSEIQNEIERASRCCMNDLNKKNNVSDPDCLTNPGAPYNKNLEVETKVYYKSGTASSHPEKVSGDLEKITEPLGNGGTEDVYFGSSERLRQRAIQFLSQLEADYSRLFTIHRPPPLQPGIQKSLFRLYPAVPRKVIRFAIGLHTNRLCYLRSIRPGYSRYDIDLKPGISVTESEVSLAKAKVIARKRKLKVNSSEDRSQSFSHLDMH